MTAWHFECLFYMGDGANDFCPMELLAVWDVAVLCCCYPMYCLIQEAQKGESSSFGVHVVPWGTVSEVRQYLQQVLKMC